MSLKLAAILSAAPKKKRNREEMLALRPAMKYEDGRTKQSFRDETDINKIMSRFEVTGTISHVNKFEGVYADFSDFDFQKQMNMLKRGEAIFADLPAELRKEFGQSAADFFDFVNDPANKDDLLEKLPALAEPGQQLPRKSENDADTEAALAAARKLVTSADNKEDPPPDKDAGSS